MRIRQIIHRLSAITGKAVPLIFAVFLMVFSVSSQQIVDKTVATVSDGVKTELITYSDLMWQMALQPNTPIDPPRTEDLNRALQLLIDQRLFALEAERLPRLAPTPDEINKEISDTLTHFPSTVAFEARLKKVGINSVKDENFERIISQRLAIKNYKDFRFGAFIVITPDDEAQYYREFYVPEFRRKYPGLLMPTLDEKRAEIRELLTEQRVFKAIETFLEEAKRRAVVELLLPV